jgi:hypothetical protein
MEEDDMRACGRWLVVLALLAILLSACGSAAPALQSKSQPAGSVGQSVAALAPAGQPPPAPATKPAAPQEAGSAPERMIIRSGKLSMTVADVSAGVESATVLARRLDGYVASTSLRENDGQQTATLSLRVPGPRYDEALGELRRLALRVDEESGSGQDVTEEFADLGAQLRNQEAAEAQYLELLKKAQSVEDVLKVQQRLTEVRTQIERLKGRMQLLQRRTDLAQIEVTLAAGSSLFQPLRHVAASFAASLRALEVAIGVLVASWWVLLLAGAAIWLLRRRGARPAPAPASAGRPGA